MEEEKIVETEVTETEVHEETNENKEMNKQNKSRKWLWIVVCAAIGFVSGVGGAWLTLSIQGSNGTSDVFYQSVIQTDKEGEEVKEMSVQDIVNNVKNSVVEISTSSLKTNMFMEQYITSGAGSGVILSKEGTIVTNHHVIDNADEIKVRLANGEEYDATLVASDEQTDLAVLRIKADNLQPAVLGDSDTLDVGESVVAIGNPLGSLGGTVTEGILSALDREIAIDGQSMQLLQTSAAINPGNSGGGLFNSKGELIGIVNAKSSGSDIEGLGFAIPVNIMKTVTTDLIETGKVTGRLTLGITYSEISSIQQAMQFGYNTLGLLINEVEPKSNADRAGLQKGDIIVAVDGGQVMTSADLKKALNRHKVGDKISFKVVRDTEYVDLSVELK